MRALLQRVSAAHVRVADETVGEIGAGLAILLCAMRGDTTATAEGLAAKVVRLRIFADAAGRMNRALAETGGAALVVSQFTLAAETRHGTRPGFAAAAPPDEARALCDAFADALATAGVTVARGHFGATMAVTLTNDGPVTIWLDTAA